MKTASMTDEQIVTAAHRSLRVNGILAIGILILIAACLMKAWAVHLESQINGATVATVFLPQQADRQD